MEAPAPTPPEKWGGTVKVEAEATVSSLWETASDFCGLSKWMPSVEECSRIEGDHDKSPGCLRRVVGTSVPREDGEKSWVDERLVSLDEDKHSLSYVLEAGNVPGLRGYGATLRVLEPDSENHPAFVEWSFEMDPIPDSSEEVSVEFISSLLRRNVRDLVSAAQKHTGQASFSPVHSHNDRKIS